MEVVTVEVMEDITRDTNNKDMVVGDITRDTNNRDMEEGE